MTEISVATPYKKVSKKEIRDIIQKKLSDSIADYRSIVGEKKFDSRIKKTARVLGDDIIKALPKKQKKVKKTKQKKDS